MRLIRSEAVTMRDEIERRVEQLRVFPYSARVGRAEGTRELIIAHTPFIVIYTVGDDIILVRVLHGAQQWPPRDEDSV